MTRSAPWYDVHSRFARAHLRTREERAVYFSLVAQLAGSWSAAELAGLEHLDPDTVAAVLDRYTVAGIVEAVDAPTGRRYRWRSDMTYLYGAEPGTTSPIDPVCGMTVDEATPHRARDASGGTQLFCSATCASMYSRAAAASNRPDASSPRPAPGAEHRRPGVLTLLYVETCPGFPLLAERLRAALARTWADGLLVRARAIHEAEPPIAGFAGSPTLLINGADPFPATAPSTALACRYYRTEAGLDAAPSVEQLITALATHFTGREQGAGLDPPLSSRDSWDSWPYPPVVYPATLRRR